MRYNPVNMYLQSSNRSSHLYKQSNMTGAGTYNSDELVPHPNRRLRTLTDHLFFNKSKMLCKSE